uniref:Uncharacterized protein n=1 Tax=Candidatus Caldatribacterium californiense TaxID=1454726 RepID=A0A7V3YHH2_9BACT
MPGVFRGTGGSRRQKGRRFLLHNASPLAGFAKREGLQVFLERMLCAEYCQKPPFAPPEGMPKGCLAGAEVPLDASPLPVSLLQGQKKCRREKCYNDYVFGKEGRDGRGPGSWCPVRHAL